MGVGAQSGVVKTSATGHQPAERTLGSLQGAEYAECITISDQCQWM